MQNEQDEKIYLHIYIGSDFFGLVGLVAFVVRRTVEWTSILLGIIIPTINLTTIHPAFLFALTILLILILGLIIDKLLKKWLSNLMQGFLDKCSPVLTENNYLAFKIGENTVDGVAYAACVEPLLHLVPYILAGPLKIIPKINLKKFVIAPLDLITLIMASFIGLDKFSVASFKKNDETDEAK